MIRRSCRRNWKAATNGWRFRRMCISKSNSLSRDEAGLFERVFSDADGDFHLPRGGGARAERNLDPMLLPGASGPQTHFRRSEGVSRHHVLPAAGQAAANSIG